MWAILVPMIIGGLAQAMASLVGRALLAIGFAYVTYTGVEAGMNALYQQMQDALNGMPADFISFLAWLWVDKAIAMVFSAWTAALALRLAGGSLTKMVLKK